MKLIILVFFFIPFNYMAADMMYVPNVAAAFNAQNIVSGEVASYSEDTQTYKFVVDDSYKGTGIRKGQTITIHQPRYGALQVNNGDGDKRYLLYLTKTDQAYVLYSRTQNVYVINDNFIPFTTCTSTYKMRSHTFKRMLADLFRCFAYESMYVYRAKVSRATYYNDDQHHDAVLNFYNCHESANTGPILEEPPIYEPEQLGEDIHNFCELEPKPMMTYKDLIDIVQASIPDSVFTKEDIGRTRWYIEFVVEKDSSISNVKMAKSFNARYDEMMLDIIKKLDTKWIPGQHDNQPVRCKAIIPVIVRLE